MTGQNPHELERCRVEIDGIDKEILGLLKQRADVVGVIGEIKAEAGMPPYQPDRYNALVERLTADAEAIGLDPEYAIGVWGAIHEVSLRQQERDRTQPAS